MTKHKVLEMIPEEARRKVAERRVFDRSKFGSFHQCADGLCVWGALLHEMGKPIVEGGEEVTRPTAGAVAQRLGVPIHGRNLGYTRKYREIVDIVALNDAGDLTTPEAVKKLLLGE